MPSLHQLAPVLRHAALALAAALAPLHAQTYDLVEIAHTQSYTQTAPTTVVASDTDGDAGTTNFYHFFAAWHGTALNLVPPDAHGYPFFTLSHTTSSTAYDPATTSQATTQSTFVAWEWDYASQAALNAAMPNGTWQTGIVAPSSGSAPYTFGVPLTAVSLTGDLYPNTPEYSYISQGNFVDGVLHVDPTQSLTFTSNNFTDNFAAGSTRITLQIEDSTGHRIGDAVTLTDFKLSLTLAVGDLVSGESYRAKLEFDHLTDTATSDINAFTGHYIGGLTDIEAFYATYTTLDFVADGAVSAVPEPSTYAALLGAAALGLAGWRRRRNTT